MPSSWVLTTCSAVGVCASLYKTYANSELVVPCPAKMNVLVRIKGSLNDFLGQGSRAQVWGNNSACLVALLRIIAVDQILNERIKLLPESLAVGQT
jgi:hypothetical protein